MRRLLVTGALWLCAAVPLAAQQPPQGPSPASASALPWLKLEEMSATRERPLFAQDRRPPQPPRPAAPPPALAAAKPAPAKTPVPILKGIIVQGASILVVLQDRTTSESIVVRSGDYFGPWRVVAESDHSVRLARGGEQIQLELFQE